MRELLVSFHHSDRDWAERIVRWLRAARYEVIWQEDFPPGADFVAEIDRRLAAGALVLAVLSPESLQAAWPTHERNVALHAQLESGRTCLLQVIVQTCKPRGLLSILNWIDLTGLSEGEARLRLLDGVRAALDASNRRGNSEGEEGAAGPSRRRLLSPALRSGLWRWAAAAVLTMLPIAFLDRLLVRAERGQPQLEQPSTATFVQTLEPLESDRRGAQEPIKALPTGAYAVVVMIPLEAGAAVDYCFRLFDSAGRQARGGCGLRPDDHGLLTLGFPPNSLRPGLFHLMVSPKDLRLAPARATYAFQVEDRQ